MPSGEPSIEEAESLEQWVKTQGKRERLLLIYCINRRRYYKHRKKLVQISQAELKERGWKLAHITLMPREDSK